MSKKRKQSSSTSPAAPSPEPKAASSFELRYTEDAAKEIKELDGSIKKRLRNILDKKLAVNPEGYGLPLGGPLSGYWKHEFADHRVIYRIYPEPPTVVVCAVGPRKTGDAEDIYKQLDAVSKTGRLAEQLASVLNKFLPKKK
jgi:mRNA-degrading endonuclease RelE of RelBE toxin-antitoxin system